MANNRKTSSEITAWVRVGMGQRNADLGQNVREGEIARSGGDRSFMGEGMQELSQSKWLRNSPRFRCICYTTLVSR